MVKYLIEIAVATGIASVFLKLWPEIERKIYLQKVRATCPHPMHLFDPDLEQPDPEHYVGFCMECYQKISYCVRA